VNPRTPSALAVLLALSAVPSLHAAGPQAPVAAPQAQQAVRLGDAWFLAEQGVLYPVDGEVISARFAPGIAGLAGLLARVPAEVRAELAGLAVVRSNALGIVDLQLPAGADPVDMVARLAATGLVDFAELNASGTYGGIPNDPQFFAQWSLHNTGQSGGTPDADVDAPEAWDSIGGAPSVVVAVLDSGSEHTHSDLAANIWHNPGEVPGNSTDDDGNGFVDDTIGWNFDSNHNNPAGFFFHGTAVAGVVGAVGNNGIGIAGLAGGGTAGAACRVMPLNCGSFSPNTAVIDDAVLYAANNGARVITLSLQLPYTQAVTDAIAFAVNVKGCFVDCAAGNNGPDVTFPANLPTVMAVASTNRFDVKSFFSNPGLDVEVAAPGEQILMLDLGNGYLTSDGTSFAAPLVAALAGLVFAANPALTAADVRQILRDTADDVGPPGFDNGTGFGRINAVAAITAAGSGVLGKTVVYGTGLAGFEGQTPIITAEGGTPKIGNEAFVVTLRRARPSSPAGFAIGVAQAALPFKGGTLLVDLDGLSAMVLHTTSATGAATMPLPIGLDPAFAGLELDAQWLVLDEDAVAGVALSAGLEITVGS
jgi:hypothetical protein